jgi:hypothetical protein
VDSSHPKREGDGEADAGQEVAGCLVVSGGDGAPILDAAERALDEIALPVGFGIEVGFVDPIGLEGNDRLTALCGEEMAQVVSVVGGVANQAGRQSGRCQQCPSTVDIVRLSRRQQEGVEASLAIGKRVDFRGAPATRAADGLALLPPLAPEAAR